MKPVFCTMGGSMNNVCHVSTVHTLFPENWRGNTRQDECDSIESIKRYIEETGAELVMFAIRSNGIPNRAVKVSDTEKLDKAFKKLETVLCKVWCPECRQSFDERKVVVHAVYHCPHCRHAFLPITQN